MSLFDDELRKAQQFRAQINAREEAERAAREYENRAIANQAAQQKESQGGLGGILSGIAQSIGNVGKGIGDHFITLGLFFRLLGLNDVRRGHTDGVLIGGTCQNISVSVQNVATGRSIFQTLPVHLGSLMGIFLIAVDLNIELHLNKIGHKGGKDQKNHRQNDTAADTETHGFRLFLHLGNKSVLFFFFLVVIVLDLFEFRLLRRIFFDLLLSSFKEPDLSSLGRLLCFFLWCAVSFKPGSIRLIDRGRTKDRILLF